jgi:hypothetical protein
VGLDNFGVQASDGSDTSAVVNAAVEVFSVETFDQLSANIFSPRCGVCHIDAANGGLTLSSYDAAKTTGNNGPGIVPGQPNNSGVYVRISNNTMPPQPAVGVGERDRARIRLWIANGADE